MSGETGAETTDAGRYAVLRVPAFRRYVLGRFVASLGQQMLGVAVGWELYERTGSALALGLVGLAQIGPMVLLTLPAGQLADRRDRRTIILWAQWAVAASSLGLAVGSFTGAPVGLTHAWLTLSGTARAFLWPASGAFLPNLVSRPLLPTAVTWNSGLFQLSAALGPGLGGLALAVAGRAWPVYGFNVAAALLCAALLAGIKTPAVVGAASPAPAVSPGGRTTAGVSSGIAFVLRNPLILSTITLDLFAVLLGGATALLPVYCKDILRVGPEGLGALQAALPVGSVATALFLAHRPPLARAGRALLWAVAGFGLATVGFGFSRNYVVSWLMLFVCGALDNVSVVVRHTLVPLLTPDAMRGRVAAVNAIFIGASNELGSLESGLVASLFGPVAAVVSGGVGTVLVVLVAAVVWPELRRFGRLDDHG